MSCESLPGGVGPVKRPGQAPPDLLSQHRALRTRIAVASWGPHGSDLSTISPDFLNHDTGIPMTQAYCEDELG